MIFCSSILADVPVSLESSSRFNSVCSKNSFCLLKLSCLSFWLQVQMLPFFAQTWNTAPFDHLTLGVHLDKKGNFFGVIQGIFVLILTQIELVQGFVYSVSYLSPFGIISLFKEKIKQCHSKFIIFFRRHEEPMNMRMRNRPGNSYYKLKMWWDFLLVISSEKRVWKEWWIYFGIHKFMVYFFWGYFYSIFSVQQCMFRDVQALHLFSYPPFRNAHDATPRAGNPTPVKISSETTSINFLTSPLFRICPFSSYTSSQVNMR